MDTATDSLERARLEFEREKWQFERTLREREQANRDAEVALRREEQARSRWRSPLVVGIFAAAVAAAGNAVVAFVNGRLQRDLEDGKAGAQLVLEQSKAESDRILEMIKTDDPDKAAENLAFLLDTGLVNDQQHIKNLRAFLQDRKPGSGPSLPGPTSSRFGFEPTSALTQSVQALLESNLSSYIDYLDKVGFTNTPKAVRIRIDNLDTPNAFYQQGSNTIVVDAKLSADRDVISREYMHHVLFGTETPGGAYSTPHLRAIESGLADYFPCSFSNDPHLGEASASVFGRPYIRSLANQRSFAELEGIDRLQMPYDGAEVWGGAFWEIREQIRPEVLDPILARAWQSVSWPAEDAEAAPAFLEALLAVANVNGGDQRAAIITEVLRKRGFPLRS